MKNPKTCKCGKKFEYPSHLTRHLDHHDPKSVKERFKCQKCDADFSENYSLKRHMRTIHKKSQFKRCSKEKTVEVIRNVPNSTKSEKSEKSTESEESSENELPLLSDATNDLNKILNDDFGLNKKGMVPSVHEGKKAYKISKKQSLEDSQDVPNSTSSSLMKNELPFINTQKVWNGVGFVTSVHEGKKAYKIPKKQSVVDSQSVRNTSLIENEEPFIDSTDDQLNVLNVELGPNKKNILQSVHEGKKEFKCELCGKKFESKKKWFMHNWAKCQAAQAQKQTESSYEKYRNISVEDNQTTIKSQKSLGKCQNSKTSNHNDQTLPPLSLRNMFVLDEWTNSDSEQLNN